MSIEIEDIMVYKVITIEADATVRDAAKLMNKHDIGCLVVVEKEKPIWNCNRKRYAKKSLSRV